MTTRVPTVVNTDRGQVITWTGLLNGDDGTPVGVGEDFADRSVHILGTFGTGGTALVEGTLDGTNYGTLTDSTGTALSVTAAKLRAVVEIVKYIRPRISAGDGSTDLTVVLFIRRPRG